MKKQLALSIALITAGFTYASDFDDFMESTTIDLKVRSAIIQMNANDVEYDTEYDAGTAATLYLQANPGGGDFAAFGLTTPATLGAYLAGNPATLSVVNAGINSSLEEQVEAEGTLDQAGSAVWVQMESGYLYDMIGFDLGFQGALKHFKEDTSSKLLIAEQGYDSLSRLSTARVKVKYGNEDMYVKANYGLYSAADETDYLLDNVDQGYGVSGHFKEWSLSYDAVTAVASETEEVLTEYDTKEETIALAFTSAVGKASAERVFMKDITTTDSFSAVSGIPLSMLGLNVPEDKKMDYLLIGQADYATKSIDSDSDFDASQYEIMLALKLQGVTLATSYNSASEDGGAGVENLVDKALLNDYDLPGQTTLTYAVSLDGAMFNVPGLSVGAVMLTSKIDDMSATSTTYQLTGEDSFTETLVDASYTFQEGNFLEGLSVRTVFGGETNQANVTGYGVYLDYNKSF